MTFIEHRRESDELGFQFVLDLVGHGTYLSFIARYGNEFHDDILYQIDMKNFTPLF